jgi:hypothetical protein
MSEGVTVFDLLIIYCFMSPSRMFHLYRESDVTITGEGLQNLGLCLALWAFEQGGIFIVPHGVSVFPVSSEGHHPPPSFSPLLRDTREYGESILT